MRRLRVFWAILAIGVVTAIHFPHAGSLIAGWFSGNFHVVVPGEVYRRGQPSAIELEQLVRQYGIVTVVNLRGKCSEDWYAPEVATLARLGVRHEDVDIGANCPAERIKLRRLVDLLCACPTPVLFHCNTGGDRSGLAAAFYLLLRTDATLTDARAQLSLRYGHVSHGRRGWMDRLLDRYSDWLDSEQVQHSPARLKWWVNNVYDPYSVGEIHCSPEGE